MKCKIEVKSTDVKELKGTSKTGRPYQFCKQEAWFHRPDRPYPEAFELTVDSPEKAYKPGFYGLSDMSLFVNRNGQLAINPVLDLEVAGK